MAQSTEKSFVIGKSQKSSLIQHLQEQLENKNMIFNKNQLQLSNAVGQGMLKNLYTLKILIA